MYIQNLKNEKHEDKSFCSYNLWNTSINTSWTNKDGDSLKDAPYAF